MTYHGWWLSPVPHIRIWQYRLHYLLTQVLFVIPFSKWLLGDVKKYTQSKPLLAAAFIVASVAVSLLPMLLSPGEEEPSAAATPHTDEPASWGRSGGDTAAWVLVYLVSLVPGALEGVLEQMYLIRCELVNVDASISS